MSFIPLHLCTEINSVCFKCIIFSVSSVMIVNNYYVHFIWSYVNKTSICSITSCIPLKHLFQKLYLYTVSFILCIFYYPKHCTFCSVSWKIQGFYMIKMFCVWGSDKREMMYFCIFKGHVFLYALSGPWFLNILWVRVHKTRITVTG